MRESASRAIAEVQRIVSVLTEELEVIDLTDFANSPEVVEDGTTFAANALKKARAIAQHHFGPSFFALPTKEGKLDWSLGEAVRPIQEKTGANYALFTWVRDSYASPERKATMVALALLGVVIPGGIQVGYASLVELGSGRIL